MRPLRAQLEATTYVGPEGLVRFYDDLYAEWEDLQPPDRRDPRARGPGGGAAAAGRPRAGERAQVEVRSERRLWRVRDGLVRRVESFSDPDDALRAAELLGE